MEGRQSHCLGSCEESLMQPAMSQVVGVCVCVCWGEIETTAAKLNSGKHKFKFQPYLSDLG